MPTPAKLYALPRRRRGALDRDATRARVAADFAAGALSRRIDIGTQLCDLARELVNGEHGEAILTAASRLLQVCAKARAETR